MSMNARQALQALKDGNRRFAVGNPVRGSGVDESRRLHLAEGQDPLAVVIGCSDSRVPLEIIFDQGLGDLFVIRVAGNIIASSQVESVEYAVGELGTPLVVILGHEGCGAVTAAVEELRADTPPLALRLPTLMESLRPVVEPLLVAGAPPDGPGFIDQVVRANVRHAVQALRESSTLVAGKEQAGDLLLVGAEYSLSNGVVGFFDS